MSQRSIRSIPCLQYFESFAHMRNEEMVTGRKIKANVKTKRIEMKNIE